ncbi:MAG: hypothetical protein ACE5NJ_05135, partial [Thermodesulfobacteriota bacterium]
STVRNKNWYYRLYRKINDIREEKMINFAIKRWGVEDEYKKQAEINSETPNEKNEIFTIG